jgi:hypothetical protein
MIPRPACPPANDHQVLHLRPATASPASVAAPPPTAERLRLWPASSFSSAQRVPGPIDHGSRLPSPYPEAHRPSSRASPRGARAMRVTRDSRAHCLLMNLLLHRRSGCVARLAGSSRSPSCTSRKPDAPPGPQAPSTHPTDNGAPASTSRSIAPST